MRIQITKRPDGSGLLRCIRADGSETWQKQASGNASFFGLHDLTHFAVESTLGSRRGFFGLIAAGWSIEDTTGKGARGPLPDEAAHIEFLVGALDAERAGDVLWTADEFNENAAIHAASAGRSSPRPLTADELAGIRARRSELFTQWLGLPSGATIELRYKS